jgi:glucose/arabinose dehydrogenase
MPNLKGWRLAIAGIIGVGVGLLVGVPLRAVVADYLYMPGDSTAQTLEPNFTVDKQLVADGFELPVYVTHAGDGSGRIFVVEKRGRIRIIKEGEVVETPYLDITSIVGSSGNEQGFLSFAFHPDYKNNGLFYVSYNDKEGDTVIARYQVSSDDPDVADPDSGKQILFQEQPYPNHNGGLIKFGPDGYLYIGLGDGGSGGDPQENGQNRKSLLGKILRIDVNNGDPYSIPDDNPFANGQEGAPEVWSYGLRNPWRFSFDRATGDMYIGDVGQNVIEEIDFQPAGQGGLNFGWNIMEASSCYPPNQDTCTKNGLILPIAEYTHRMGNSVTGGYVYNGAQFPEMQGYYLYGDFSSSRLWALKQTSEGVFEVAELPMLDIGLSSFGEDEAGELYVTDYYDGGVYQLIAKAK